MFCDADAMILAIVLKNGKAVTYIMVNEKILLWAVPLVGQPKSK